MAELPTSKRASGRVPPHNLEAEESVLGAMLLSREAIAAVMDARLDGADFYRPAHGHTFDAIVALYGAGEPVDPVTVADELRRAGLLDMVGGAAALVTISARTPATSSAAHYARIIGEHALLRRLIGVAGEIAELGYSLPSDVVAAVDRAEQLMFDVAQRRSGADTTHLIRDLLDESLTRLETLYERGESITGLATGYAGLDELLCGLQPSTLNIVGARPAMGKAQPVTTPVLTPEGWRELGTIVPGDLVVGADGLPVEVLAVHPQGVVPVYRVTLSDRTSTVACANHRWLVQTHHDRVEDRPGRVRTTAEIAKDLAAGRTRHAHVPIAAPIAHPWRELPVDPYLLGLLLGDGNLTSTSPRFTSADPELHAAVTTLLPDGVDARRDDDLTVRITAGRSGGLVNPLTASLRTIGVYGHRAETKFVPLAYRTAAIAQRLAVLQGLLDTDGWYSLRSIQFASASPALAEHVAELARSLGGVARVRFKDRSPHLPSWNVTLRLAAGVEPFRLGRKLDAWRADQPTSKKPPEHSIVSIEPAGEADSVCITVDADDGLYVTENYIVTHNTAFGLGIASHVACRLGEPALFFSLEMGHQELTERVLAAEARIDSKKLRTGRLTEPEWGKVSHAIGRVADAPLFIDDNPHATVMDIRAKARRLKAKHGLAVVVVDYVQLMTGVSSRPENRQVEVSEMSRGLKVLARELEIPVVALSQLSRALELRADKRPMLADLRESGSLEQDADVVMFVYRDEVYHPDSADKGSAEVIVAKHRAGPTGLDRLAFLGSYAKFENMARGL